MFPDGLKWKYINSSHARLSHGNVVAEVLLRKKGWAWFIDDNNLSGDSTVFEGTSPDIETALKEAQAQFFTYLNNQNQIKSIIGGHPVDADANPVDLLLAFLSTNPFVVIDPGTCDGAPTLKGTQTTLFRVFSHIADGGSIWDISEDMVVESFMASIADALEPPAPAALPGVEDPTPI